MREIQWTIDAWGISLPAFGVGALIAALLLESLGGSLLDRFPVLIIPVLCFGIITGKVWYFMGSIGWGRIFFWFCLISGVVLGGVLVFFVVNGVMNRPAISTPPPPPPPPTHPIDLSHGCKSLQIAKDIVLNNRWLVGPTPPPAVWLADSFQYTTNHAGPGGYVVKVLVSPNVQLIHKGDCIWIAPIPNARIMSQYYRIPGVTPVAIFDTQKKKVFP